MCLSPRTELRAAAKAARCDEQPLVPPAPQSRSRSIITPLLPFLVIGSGIVHGGLQENLMRSMGGAGTPLVITALEFACCASLSIGWLLLNRCSFDVPRWQLFQISMLVLLSLVTGNLALRWVSYPVKVVLKSTKLLPTMAIGAALLGKRYSLADCCAALLLCLGLVGFTLFDAERAAGQSSSPVGVALLLFAVSCDSVQVILQERMLRARPDLTPMHVMAHTNGFAFLVLASFLVGRGEWGVAPSSLPWASLLFYGASAWVGVCAFIALTREWGATAAVLATNTRKVATVALSFVLFPKPLSRGFALSGGLVCTGIYLHSWARRRAKDGKGAKGA